MVRPITNWRARMRIAAGHGLAHHRLARARDQAAHHRAPIMRAGLGDEPAGQHQRPGRGVDEERLRMTQMPRPVGRRELVADEAVDCGRVGNAQQRLGETEERDPFLRRQPVFRQEHVDPAAAMAARPRLGDEAARGGGDAALYRGRDLGGGENAFDRVRLVLAIGLLHRPAQRIGWRKRFGMDPGHTSRPCVLRLRGLCPLRSG